MATKKAAKTAKKAPQPVKKTPVKAAAVKPVSKVAKKAEPAKAAPKKVAATKKAAPAKAAVKSNSMAKPVAKAKASAVSKTAAAKPAPASSQPKAATKAKEAPAIKHTALAKPSAPLPKKSTPEPVAAKPGLAKPVPAAAKSGTGQAKPAAAPVKSAAPVVVAKPVAPVRPAEVKAEPKSTVIARPTPKPETKLVELKPIKTSVATTVKYEPDFTKSVLDDPGHTILNAPTMRYSDAELAEFKDLIMRKLEAAKKELTYLQGLITRKDEMGGDESENRYMTMEDGSISMEREQLSQMASRQIQFIDHLEKAIMRIENKTYGICRVTGKLIDKARLRAVPHATLSIEAKMGLVKKAENQNIQ
jgi:RNA polymerase-binding transcription factor DksA